MRRLGSLRSCKSLSLDNLTYGPNDANDNRPPLTHSEVHAYASALGENQWLEKLDLFHKTISNENWNIMMKSITNHPTLQDLDIAFTAGPGCISGLMSLSADETAARNQSISDMLQTNKVLHTIGASEDMDDHIFQGSISPRLQANLSRQRVRAIKQVRDLLL
jgi:nucleosome binding factor SPN SPT16 subunit